MYVVEIGELESAEEDRRTLVFFFNERHDFLLLRKVSLVGSHIPASFVHC